MKEPIVIPGGVYSDERGILYYNNNFDLGAVKRFHILEHPETEVFRAWHGHKLENKWFQVLNGSFAVLVVQPDDWLNPSRDLEVKAFTLTGENNEVLHVPNGFATGFRALQPDSQLGVFSDKTVEESKKDDYRFDKGFWEFDFSSIKK